jgi:hypothetical protein
MSVGLSADLAKEKSHGASQFKQKQSEKAQELLVKQDPSMTTGIQWAYSQAPQAVQAQASVQKAEGQTVQSKPMTAEVATPEIEDLAVLSSAVSVKEEAVLAPTNQRSLLSYMRLGINPAVLEESYREIYKKSKSHNLLLERFMANVKLGGLNLLMSLTGFSAGKLEDIKAEVREGALKEIELKLSQDWAYAKALIEIMG